MSILITNVTPSPVPGQACEYVVRIRSHEVARFKHYREHGLATCFFLAAVAVGESDLLPVYKLKKERMASIIAMLGTNEQVFTGTEIADHIGVDKRTVYRYITEITRAGVPIKADRGVGYWMPKKKSPLDEPAGATKAA